MRQQLDDGVADERRGRLVARDEDQEKHRDQLVEAEARALHLGRDQPAQQVLARPAPPLPHEPPEVVLHLDAHPPLPRDLLGRQRTHEHRAEVLDGRVRPLLELRAILGGDADDLGDDDDRQRIAERLDEIHPAAGQEAPFNSFTRSNQMKNGVKVKPGPVESLRKRVLAGGNPAPDAANSGV